MAFHDISTRLWVFSAVIPRPTPPEADSSRATSVAEPSGTDLGTEPREPEWQGQWRLLKYF